jgi:hypothetical protein
MTMEPPAAPAAPPPEPPPAIDDDIYQKLIQHSEDVQGLLAYGIFCFSYDDGDIKRLRTHASDQMVQFALSIVEDERPEIEETARKSAHDGQLDDMRVAQSAELADIRNEIRQTSSLWRAVLAGVISSLVFAALTIIFVAVYFAPGLRDITKAFSH